MALTEDQVIEFLEGLNIIQLNDLVKKLETKWDVKAASGGVMMAAAPAAAEAAATHAAYDERMGHKLIELLQAAPMMKETV